MRRNSHRRLIFLDEAGCNIAMSPQHGWAPKGKAVYDQKPANGGKNVSIIGAVSNSAVIAKAAIVGPVDTIQFLEFIRRRLVPKLRPGDRVIMDNLRVHHHALVRKLVREAGAAVIYLPPYSPDLNPIEPCWAFIKNLLRQAKARTTDLLLEQINKAFRRVRERHLSGWFQHCGHGQRK